MFRYLVKARLYKDLTYKVNLWFTLGVNDSIIALEEYIDYLSKEYITLVTPTFQNISKSKKKSITLAICRVAAKLSDPTKINIKEVAKEGNISVGSLYKYFINRENMISYIIRLVRDYILAGMDFALKELSSLSLDLALYYYCAGSTQWSNEEKTLSFFFYQAAYCGSDKLSKELVFPLSQSFQHTLKNILESAISRNEIKLNKDIDYCVGFLHRSLLPITDSEIYPNLQYYYFPEGFNENNIKKYINTIISCISA